MIDGEGFANHFRIVREPVFKAGVLFRGRMFRPQTYNWLLRGLRLVAYYAQCQLLTLFRQLYKWWLWGAQTHMKSCMTPLT